jgi:hypothetical protein
MSNNGISQEAVYIALKDIFSGQEAQIRKMPAISSRVDKFGHRLEISDLIQKHGKIPLCETAKYLLKEGIFESSDNAKAYLPKVFESSTSEGAAAGVSQPSAPQHKHVSAQSVAEAPQKDVVKNDYVATQQANTKTEGATAGVSQSSAPQHKHVSTQTVADKHQKDVVKKDYVAMQQASTKAEGAAAGVSHSSAPRHQHIYAQTVAEEHQEDADEDDRVATQPTGTEADRHLTMLRDEH